MARPSPFTNYSGSVYSAFGLNVKNVMETDQIAGAMLCIIAVLDETGIQEVILRSFIEAYAQGHTIGFNDLRFADSLALLRAFSLITTDRGEISTHLLFQAFLRDSQEQGDVQIWALFAIQVMTAICPYSEDEYAYSREWEALEDHVITVSQFVDFDQCRDKHVEALLNNTASHLHMRARNEQALPLMEKALSLSQSIYGINHPNTARVLNNMSGIVYDLGDRPAGIELQKRAIDLFALTKSSRNKYAVELGKALSNLGRMQIYQRDPISAFKNLRRAHFIHQSELGREHFSTAIDVNNIGALHREQRDWFGAYGHFTEAVRIHRNAVAANDLRLAIALRNLGEAAFHLNGYLNGMRQA